MIPMRKPRGKVDPVVRFWKKVDKNGPIVTPELGPCWLWTGSKRAHGHGHFIVPGVGTSAHQFSYFIHKGPIPKGLLVTHACDVGACVNPAHLSCGTQKDNMSDAAKRGRTSRGESHPFSIFTEDQVKEIRELYTNGMRVWEIMNQFKVSRSAISHIVHQDRWKHVQSDDAVEKRGSGEAHYAARFTASQAIEIYTSYHVGGESLTNLSKRFNVPPSTIQSIKNGGSWSHITSPLNIPKREGRCGPPAKNC